MRVFLMRHGIAIDRNDPDCPPDPQRALTAVGRKRTRQAALGLKWLGVAPGLVLTSPYVRTRQTAEIVAETLRLPSSAIEDTDALRPEADPALLLPQLRRRRRFEVLCVGHLPQLDWVIARLLQASDPVTELRKSGVAYVDWPARGQGDLVWLATPKLLRRLGG